MLDLLSLAEPITARRKALRLTQTALAAKAGVSRSTIDALENQRVGELGYSKVTHILAVLGLELGLRDATSQRPTLEDLARENEAEDRAKPTLMTQSEASKALPAPFVEILSTPSPPSPK